MLSFGLIYSCTNCGQELNAAVDQRSDFANNLKAGFAGNSSSNKHA